MRHYAFRYLHEWEHLDNRPKYSSQPQSAQVDPGDNKTDVIDEQSDSDFAENPEIFDGYTANRHEICWKMKMRDVSRHRSLFICSSSLKGENVMRWKIDYIQDSTCMLFYASIKSRNCRENEVRRLWSMLREQFLPYVSASRYALTEPERSKTHIDFTLWLRRERFIYTCCIDRDPKLVDKLVG